MELNPISRAQQIMSACSGRMGNMSRRNQDESDDDFARRLDGLALRDIKQKADVYVAPGVTEGIAGFYVDSGAAVDVEGFVRVGDGR